MIEVWRSVVGYEGYYEVSNWGRVKSLNYRHTGQERVLKPHKIKGGYLQVGLSKDGIQKTFYVHRLVGIAFPDLVDWTEDAKGKPFNELEINHKREKEKTNNHVECLEWCDRKYNANYGTGNTRRAKATAERCKGVYNTKISKPVTQKTKDGEFVREWPSTNEVERQTGWSHQAISCCCRGERKSAYGYCWEYVEQ